MDAAVFMESSFGSSHKALENAYGVSHERPQALLPFIFGSS
jgi:hypothetical protein